MKIGKFDLDSGHVFIIAELSANHNGSLQTALDSIDAAKEAGADSVKIQTYTADTLTLNCDREDFVIKGGTLWDDKTLYSLYQEAYTPWDWHAELFEHARKIGIDIFSSPFDRTAVDLLEQLNTPAYKIASYEITDHALIKYAASKGRPMILSTGIAGHGDIEDAVNICRSAGNSDIVLLQCTSAYPAPLEDANLRTIPDMAERFDVYTGFSDHTTGITAPIAAVALGASVIEKHFILDRSAGGPDADFSLNRQEFADMVKAVRDTEKLLGFADYSMTDKKMKNRRFARSLYVAKDIKKGGVFTEENIRSVRPGYGAHPKYLERILGTKADKDYRFGDRFETEETK